MKAHSRDKTTRYEILPIAQVAELVDAQVSRTVGTPWKFSLLLGTIAGVNPTEEISLVLQLHKGDLPDGLTWRDRRNRCRNAWFKYAA